MIDQRVRTKVKEVVELAMLINDTPTTRKETGDKPTVFVDFSGHTCGLIVAICGKGWDRKEPYNESTDETIVYLDDKNDAKVRVHLDHVIRQLKDIYDEWGLKEDGN